MLTGLAAKIRYYDSNIVEYYKKIEFYKGCSSRGDSLVKEAVEKNWTADKFKRRLAVIDQYMPEGGY